MTNFTNGQQVKLHLANVSCINNRVYDGITATVDFQCRTVEGIQGLVYVQFLRKGKRKMTTLCLHTDSLELI